MERSKIHLMNLFLLSMLLQIMSCSASTFNGTATVNKEAANGSGDASNGYINKNSSTDTTNSNNESTASDGISNGNDSAAAGGLSNGLGNSTAATGPNNDNSTGSSTADNSGSAANSSDVGADGKLVPCPPRNQTILILDFKSGWWSGDGGNFVNRITSGLSLPCSGSLTLEYHHIVLSDSIFGNIFGSSGSLTNYQLISPTSPNLTQGSPDFTSAVADSTWNSYNQIWLLSGSAADPLDIQVSSSFFQQVLQKAAASKANFFIGVGYGSISHAVALASTLNIGATFSTTWPEGNILNPMAGVQVVSSISGASLFANSLLIKSGGITSLVDQVVVAGTPAHGDQIVNQGGFDIIAVDHSQQNSLAVSKAAGRKIILDADLPRYYGAWNGSSTYKDTMRLLQNIVVYLAN